MVFIAYILAFGKPKSDEARAVFFGDGAVMPL